MRCLRHKLLFTLQVLPWNAEEREKLLNANPQKLKTDPSLSQGHSSSTSDKQRNKQTKQETESINSLAELKKQRLVQSLLFNSAKELMLSVSWFVFVSLFVRRWGWMALRQRRICLIYGDLHLGVFSRSSALKQSHAEQACLLTASMSRMASSRLTFSLYAFPSIWTLFRSTTPFRPFLASFDFFRRPQQYLQVQMRQQRRISPATTAMQMTAQNGTGNNRHRAHTVIYIYIYIYNYLPTLNNGAQQWNIHHASYYLCRRGNVFTFVGLFVCLSVNKITQKVVNPFSWNLVGRLGTGKNESIRFDPRSSVFTFPKLADMAFKNTKQDYWKAVDERRSCLQHVGNNPLHFGTDPGPDSVKDILDPVSTFSIYQNNCEMGHFWHFTANPHTISRSRTDPALRNDHFIFQS